MSSGPETKFIEAVHRLLPSELHREKMHNMYRGGTFDMWYSGPKGDLWVEYKFGKNKLSALQAEWGLARHKEGRKVYVVTGSNAGCLWESLDGSACNMTKVELAAWLVEQTTGTTNAKKTRPHSKRNGKRVQNHNNGSIDIRVDKV